MISSKCLFQGVDPKRNYAFPKQSEMEQCLKSNPTLERWNLSEERIKRIASLLAGQSLSELEILEIVQRQFYKENVQLSSREYLGPALDAIFKMGRPESAT